MRNCCFRVTPIVSENHSVNVLVYKLLLKEPGHLDDDLFVDHNYSKIYLLHDAVNLIKNVRNKLLNYKRFIFSTSKYNGFEDPISFKGGEISWKLFHNVFEKDSLLEANMRKANKDISKAHKVFHPEAKRSSCPPDFS